jgi:hypothetical protein
MKTQKLEAAELSCLAQCFDSFHPPDEPISINLFKPKFQLLNFGNFFAGQISRGRQTNDGGLFVRRKSNLHIEELHLE